MYNFMRLAAFVVFGFLGGTANAIPIDVSSYNTVRSLVDDANGFVLATATGAMTPQGALVFTGAPSKRPPPRPQATTLDQPELDAAQEEEQPPVATFTSRPALRPEDLVPPIQEVALVDPALAGVRPKPRPAGLAPVSATDPEPQTPAVTVLAHRQAFILAKVDTPGFCH